MSDYEVIWDGKGAIPGMSADGWTQRSCRLTDHAPEDDEPCVTIGRTVNVGHGGGPGRGAKGVVMYPAKWCACGEAISRNDVRKGYARCRHCRAQGRAARKAA